MTLTVQISCFSLENQHNKTGVNGISSFVSITIRFYWQMYVQKIY